MCAMNIKFIPTSIQKYFAFVHAIHIHLYISSSNTCVIFCTCVFSYNNQSMSHFRASRRGASCVFESNIDIALDKIFLARATTCTPISRSCNFCRASQLLMYHEYSSPDLENNHFRHKKYLPLHKELPRLKYQVSL